MNVWCAAADTCSAFNSIIGKSDATKELIELSRRAACTSSYVIVAQATDKGKELFA
ncbi:hypothetical protein [Domibacillus robiginosus]|uniref:hypothetical protein n=1 Tax=Domibacillus robiginosus TaxID=1071054 RepID=UPI0012E0A170|nr:hypothetical protein [Domibacillus robiginosus]